MAGRGGRSSGPLASVHELRERVRDVSHKLDDVSERLTAVAERVEAAERDRAEMANDIRDIKTEVQSLLIMSSRWKGGFLALAALGGLVGWVLTSWESLLYILNLKR